MVISGVNDGGVRLGDFGAYVTVFFKHRDTPIESCEISCRKTAEQTGAYYRDIIVVLQLKHLRISHPFFQAVVHLGVHAGQIAW